MTSQVDGAALGARRRGCARSVVVGVMLALWAPGVRAGLGRPSHVLRIFKAERRMQLEIDGNVVRTFRVALGGDARGDKEAEGDSKTPEGELYIAWKNARSQFHRFLGLSYPMPKHADRGLAEGRISREERDAIVRAVRRHDRPPQGTRLGGFVGIHGGGVSSDWTLGCIAVSDAEAEWLFEEMRVGDAVFIAP